MKSKVELIYLGVLLLFLYACTDLLKPSGDGLSNHDVAQAYVELDAVVSHIDALSQPKSRAGVGPLIHQHDKQRLGEQVRKAKGLIDVTHRQVQAGADSSYEFTEARKTLDALNEEIAPLLVERNAQP